MVNTRNKRYTPVSFKKTFKKGGGQLINKSVNPEHLLNVLGLTARAGAEAKNSKEYIAHTPVEYNEDPHWVDEEYVQEQIVTNNNIVEHKIPGNFDDSLYKDEIKNNSVYDAEEEDNASSAINKNKSLFQEFVDTEKYPDTSP